MSLNSIFEFDIFKKIVLTCKRNLTEQQLKELYKSNDSENIKLAINYMLDKNDSNIIEIVNSEDYQKIEALFKKTRLKDFPSLDTFKVIPLDLAKKFRLKVFKMFDDNHLFANPLSLINMIGVFGLFERDEDVEKRISTISKIFFFQNAFSKRNIDDSQFVQESKKTTYVLNENIINDMPDELKIYLFPEISPKYYSFIKKMNGNFGRKINDFMFPYARDNEFYRLKDGAKKHIKIFGLDETDIFEKIDFQKYEILKNDERYSSFLSPYTKEIIGGFGLKYGLSLEERKQALKLFKGYELEYSDSDIQSMFNNAIPIYNPDFYNFFVNHQSEISVSTNNFSKLSDVQKKYNEVKQYYLSRGNPDPDFITIIEWLRHVPYNVEFGDEQFAMEAKNAGVLAEGYDYYVELLKTLKKRYKRAIPNHKKFYSYMGKDGKEYKVQTKILSGTDPLNLLIGESKYTDCCQKYNDLGQVCLEHAATSKLGGILVVNLLEENCLKVLCQSWVWINEQELVLDNVEQTNILNSTPAQQREIYEDLIADVLKRTAEDILFNSNVELRVYVEKELSKLKNITDLEYVKIQRKRLLEILERQSIKVITIGANYSDIIVSDYFAEKAERELYLPKDYIDKGYTDAERRYVAAGKEEDIVLYPSTDYIEEPIYVVPRNIEYINLENLNNEIIRRLLIIDKRNISDGFGLKEFIINNQYDINNVNLMLGEDWYCLYRGNEILKLSIGTPRLYEEFIVQKNEINECLSNICDNKIKGYCRKLEVKL